MRRPLSRRTLIRGLGTSIALPGLQAMLPARASAATAPLKFIAVYLANGVINRGAPNTVNNYWRPVVRSETDWDLSRTMEPLREVKQYVTPVLGLYNHAHKEIETVDGRATPGLAHFTEATSFLTGQPQAWDWANIPGLVRLLRPGRSIDQEMADKAVAETPGGFKVRSLVMGTMSPETFESGGKGHKYLLNHVSWRNQNELVTRHYQSSAVFKDLFGDGTVPGNSADAARLARLRKQKLDILHFASGQANTLKQSLGPADRIRLDEFLTGLGELDKRIQDEQTISPAACAIPSSAGYASESLTKRAQNMADLAIRAFECGLTRVSTFMLDTAHQGIPLEQRIAGVAGGHHQVSHYASQETPGYGLPADVALQSMAAVNRWQMEQLAYLLKKLRDTIDVDGRPMIENTMVMYGCGIGDGDYHNVRDIAMILAGRGGGLPAGRCKVLDNEPRHSNLLLSLLRKWGLNSAAWGNSTGPLEI